MSSVLCYTVNDIPLAAFAELAEFLSAPLSLLPWLVF